MSTNFAEHYGFKPAGSWSTTVRAETVAGIVLLEGAHVSCRAAGAAGT